MKVRKFLVVLILLFSSLFFSCDSILDMLGLSSNGSTLFTNTEAVEAMKSALNIGAESSSKQLSKEDAYYGNDLLKIFLPDEVYSALAAVDKLKGLEVFGFDIGSAVSNLSGKLVENVVLSVNRSAEHAAKDVVPIFSKAITGMTVQDGIKIVTGEDDAATEYLKENTYSELMKLYQPMMDEVLKKDLIGEVSANEAWNNLTEEFNNIVNNDKVKVAAALANKTLPPPINTNLSEYVTGKALDGLFVKVEEEEGKIRENPFGYASNIVQKVFGAVKNGLGS